MLVGDGEEDMQRKRQFWNLDKSPDSKAEAV